jgi:hypothetical protein
MNPVIRNIYKNNKIFVLTANSNFLGGTETFHQSFVPDPKSFNNEYNILTHHSRYNYQSISPLMPNGTVFVTILRDPIDQFESTFDYFNLDKFWNIKFDSFGDQTFKISTKKNFFQRTSVMIGIIQVMFDLGLYVSDYNKLSAVKKCRKRSLSKLIAIEHFLFENIRKFFIQNILNIIFFYLKV